MKPALFVLLLFTAQYASGAVLSHTLDPALLDDLDDDAAVVQSIVDSMPESSILHIPAGTLVMSSPLVIDKKNFAVTGMDANLTFMHFTGGQDGLFVQSSQGGGNVVRISDLSILTEQAGGGAAVHGVRYTDAGQTNLPPNIELERVGISFADGGFWNYSVKSEYGVLLVVDSVFRGVNNGTNGTLCHIDYSGPSGGGRRVQMLRSRLSGARVGVSVHDTDSEGQPIINSVVEDVEIGGERYTAEPAFKWSGCRITASDVGLYLSGVRDSRVDGCLVETTAPDSTAFVMERRQTQHTCYRGNLVFTPYMLKVNTTDYQDAASKLVDSITFSGNYIHGADPGFDLTGPETWGFCLGGNVLHSTGTEFILAPDTDYIFKTRTEVQP